MSPSPPQNLLGALDTPGLVHTGPEPALLGRGIDHCSSHLGTDHHAPGPRSNLHHAGMGCSHRHCSSPCFIVSSASLLLRQ
jgi:hypothetical protein